MKKFILMLTLLMTTLLHAQTVIIDSCSFYIKHGDLTFYLDKDTASYVSVHKVKYSDLKKITGERSDKWHKEKPYGPYNKEYYVHTGYDLGHLTPSNITSYSDSLNYHSFSLFNQAPQFASFNRGKWAKIEKKVCDNLISKKSDAIIITGVIYDNVKKTYLGKSRIKIPTMFYKIVVTKTETTCYMGSNVNGEILNTDLKTILEVSLKNKNSLGIQIIK